MNTHIETMPGGEEKRTELKRGIENALKSVLSTPAFAELPRNQHPVGILTSANSAGYRPLHLASASNDHVLVQNLLEIFSNLPASAFRMLLDCRDREGNTALHWSVMSGSLDAFACLVKAGATINLANLEGRTPLHLAVCSCDSLPEQTSVSVVTHLLHHGANPNIGDQSGVTPLHMACELGNSAIIEVLVEEGGANVNVGDNEGETPLFYALRGQHDVAVRKLADYGIDIQARNGDGETVFDFCTSIGDSEMVKLLESLQPKCEELPVLNPRSLSMELSESCALSASSGIWFGSHEVRSSF